MKLWLDDVREPWKHGCLGWEWVTTATAAISALATGQVECASLDHDLANEHYPWNRENAEDLSPRGEGTGYDVVCWMEENNVWPKGGVSVHSMNPVGRKRMQVVIDKHYNS